MKNRKIECLDTLITKTECLDEMIEFLVDNNLATKDEFQSHTRQFEYVNFIHRKLTQLLEEKKLLLYEYEWTILPTHQIKLLLITEHLSKEFLYGY